MRGQEFTDMSDFGRRKIDLLRRFVPLEKGVPSHDVFSDVFRILEPEAFERVFRDFVSAFAKFHGLDLSGVFAVDGKSLCGAYERGKSACRFTWSTSLRPRPAWRWHRERRPAETSPRRLWKSCKCCG